jgi:hypothetical protein
MTPKYAHKYVLIYARKTTHYTFSCANIERTHAHKLIYVRTLNAAHIFAQVKTAGRVKNAALASTRMFPAVLRVAHVPSTPTRLLLAGIKATANATQDTQVKINIPDKHKTHTQNHSCTTSNYKFTHKDMHR